VLTKFARACGFCRLANRGALATAGTAKTGCDAGPFSSRPKAQQLMLYSSQHGPQIGSVERKRDGDQGWSPGAKLRVQYLKDLPLSKEK